MNLMKCENGMRFMYNTWPYYKIDADTANMTKQVFNLCIGYMGNHCTSLSSTFCILKFLPSKHLKSIWNLNLKI